MDLSSFDEDCPEMTLDRVVRFHWVNLPNQTVKGANMATSTFVRKIVISSPEALQRLEKVMADQTPKAPISQHPFSIEDRKRGEALLMRC